MVEENLVSAVFVRFRKGKVGLLIPAKFTTVAKELAVATALSKIITVHSKSVVFMLDSNKWPCMVTFGSYKCSFLFKCGTYSGRGAYCIIWSYPGAVIWAGAAV